jgi:GNAT superfamily N-acetyltransferase
MRQLADLPRHRPDVAEIIMSSADYSLLVKGCPPGDDDVDDFFQGLPPGCVADDRTLLGFYLDGQIIGIAKAVRRWNRPDKAILGLMLFAPAYRRRGFGSLAYARIEALARAWPGIDRLRLAVIDGNSAALEFWQGKGFVASGEPAPRLNPYLGKPVVLEKFLHAGSERGSHDLQAR